MVPGSLNMGARNVIASKQALQQAGIPIVAEDVGGDYGRSVRFYVGAGKTTVSSVGKADVVL
jgi:chemotaxis protein CheD